MGLTKDENPFLGYRAIRFCLDRKEVMYTNRSCAHCCVPALTAISRSWCRW
ncbi:MAG: putative PEP-binding protein [Clostridium sp.]